MTKARLSAQIGAFMAITFVVLEAALLMVNRLEQLLDCDDSAFTHEAKKNFNGLREGWKRVKFYLEKFEIDILPAMVTHEGKTDTVSVYDALIEDGYDYARIACRVFNAKVDSGKGFAQIEEAIKVFESDNPRLDNELIETLRLND